MRDGRAHCGLAPRSGVRRNSICVAARDVQTVLLLDIVVMRNAKRRWVSLPWTRRLQGQQKGGVGTFETAGRQNQTVTVDDRL